MNYKSDRTYYAQNREDLILESFFSELESGFYVDVGACHPELASVTKRFYLRGWTGINIEPQAALHELFVNDRNKDINLNVAVSDKKGKLVLRTYIKNRGMSTLTPEIKTINASTNEYDTNEFEDSEIKVTTLRTIFAEQKVKTIHFLKVDVEGHEYEVLKGNDWEKYRPEVICIEANHIVRDWRPLLNKNKYTLAFFDGLNEYYVDSYTDLLQKFDYVGHVLMGLKGGILYTDYEKIQKLSAEVDSLNAALARREVEFKWAKGLLRLPGKTYRFFVSVSMKMHERRR